MTNQQISKPTVHSRERGAELVEFALVFPLFLLLMVGVIEFGRAYNIYENVIHATREGVRAASADCLTGGNCTPGSYSKLTPAEIRTKIRAHLSAINISVADSDIIIDDCHGSLSVGGFKVDPALRREHFQPKRCGLQRPRELQLQFSLPKQSVEAGCSEFLRGQHGCVDQRNSGNDG